MTAAGPARTDQQVAHGLLPDGWLIVPLIDLIDPARGISYGIVQPGQAVHDGIPVLRVNNIRNGRLELLDVLRVAPEIEAKHARTRLRGGEVLLTLVGTVGEVAIAPSELEGWNVARAVAVIPPKAASAVWLAANLRSGAARRFIDSRVTTTVQVTLNLRDVNQLPIVLPPASERDAIAELLSALDDKIVLNRRTSETLEGMAQALFDSWMLDPERTSDWPRCPLPELVEVNPKRVLRAGTPAPYLDMSNVPTSGPRALNWTERTAGSGARFTNDDTLVARITPCLENGKTAFVDFLPDGCVGWGSTEYIVLRSRAPLPPQYAYLLARTDEFRAFAISHMTGSSGRQRVPAESLSRFELPAASAQLAREFGAAIEPLFDTIKTLDEESRTLATLRDGLLPRLLSGELRVRDAEPFVAAAV